MINWNNWKDSTYLWDLYPNGHPTHDKGYGDILHNAALLVSGAHLAGLPEAQALLRDFKKGIDARIDNDGYLFRDPRIDTPMDIDNLKVMIHALTLAGYEEEWIDKQIKKFRDVPGWLRPHHANSYTRQKGKKAHWFMSFFGDFMECIDAVLDWPGQPTSSRLKNVFRLLMARKYDPTWLNGLAVKIFKVCVSPRDVAGNYFTIWWIHGEDGTPQQCPVHQALIPAIDKIL